VKGTWREGSLAGGPWNTGRKGSGDEHLSIVALLGNLEGGSFRFERWMKEALGMEHFSLKRVNVEGLWGGLLYWGPWKIC
jgi:hypothetical protein